MQDHTSAGAGPGAGRRSSAVPGPRRHRHRRRRHLPVRASAYVHAVVLTWVLDDRRGQGASRTLALLKAFGNEPNLVLVRNWRRDWKPDGECERPAPETGNRDDRPGPTPAMASVRDVA